MNACCEIAYLAGLFDGEGSVSATITAAGVVGLRVQLSMTTHEGVESFAKQFGLRLSEYPRTNGNKTPIHVAIGGYQAGELLKVLQPFLKVKAKQAEVGIELAKLFESHDHKPRSMEVISKRVELAIVLRQLNL